MVKILVIGNFYYVFPYLPVSFEYFEKDWSVYIRRVLGHQLVQDYPAIRLKDKDYLTVLLKDKDYPAIRLKDKDYLANRLKDKDYPLSV